MKDLMIEWVETHKYEHPDGTWSRMDNAGEPMGMHYITEDALEAALWDYIVANPEDCLPMPW